MRTAALPKVSALMGAYNYDRYIVEAILSAMEQNYPPELLELVVVDDGSTDNTAELVGEMVERYPGRIKFVQQQNAGATAAVNRARAEASGDLMALLDADDVWLPNKTRRQVELMQANPALGLTWTRMRLIDSHGGTIYNNYGYQGPIPPNQFARVLWENVAVQSSLIIEAELFEPMPKIPYADWWLTLVAAEHKRIDYIPEDLVLYRWHGANITGGVGGPKALREAQKGIAFQRWAMREHYSLDQLLERLEPEDMSFVWTGLENQAQKGLSGLGSHFGTLAEVSDEDRRDAAADARAAQLALEDGDIKTGCALLLRARACDPFDMDLRTRFDEAIALAQTAAQLPDPLEGNRGFVIVADAEFLLADDDRLRDYAAALRPASAATLVIDASAMDHAAAATHLGELVARCGLAEDEEITMIGVVGALEPSQRFRIRSATRARYVESAPASPSADEPPAFTTESLDALRELVLTWQRRQTAA